MIYEVSKLTTGNKLPLINRQDACGKCRMILNSATYSLRRGQIRQGLVLGSGILAIIPPIASNSECTIGSAKSVHNTVP